MNKNVIRKYVYPYEMRGSPRWGAKVPDGRGGSHRKRGFISKGAADEWAWSATLRTSAGKGHQVPERRARTFAEYADSWIQAKHGITRPTQLRYQGLINFYLKPALGHCMLRTLDRGELKLVIANLERSNTLGPKSIQMIVILLNQILEEAKKDGELRDDFSRLDCPRVPEVAVMYWTPSQIEIFEASVGYDSRYLRMLFTLLTGLRAAEIAGLQWRDISILREDDSCICGWISVRRQVHQKSGAVVEWTKGKRIRQVPITPAARRLLEHIAGGRVLAGSSYIFGNGAKPIRCDNMARQVRAAAIGLSLPPITFHQLRHSYLSMMASRGVPTQALKEVAGHSSSKTTERYLHSSRDMTEASIRAALVRSAAQADGNVTATRGRDSP